MASLIIFMGPTGAGKSFLAEGLVSRYHWVHISSGELLRRNVQDLALTAHGELAPSAQVEELVAVALGQVKDDQTVILDGFPRTMDEVAWLDEHLTGLGLVLKAIVVVDITRHDSDARLAARQRLDDSPQALDAKWREYEQLTMPVVKHYESTGLVIHVDGLADVPVNADRIKKVVS